MARHSLDVEKLRSLWKADHEIGENGTEENEALRDYLAAHSLEIINALDQLKGIGVEEFLALRVERDRLASEVARLKDDGK